MNNFWAAAEVAEGGDNDSGSDEEGRCQPGTVKEDVEGMGEKG